VKRADTRHLATEQRNRAAQTLDLQSALGIARTINREDRKVAIAVGRVLPQVARAIDVVAEALASGGRLIYAGAGTSGRIAALDASECPPTFGVDPGRVVFLIAGGERALARASEVSEDSVSDGERDMARLRPTRRDAVVGIAASGRTPYTVAAIEYARARGAKTIAVVCNRGSQLAQAAGLAIEIETGPEVVAGSTRMKAGTAQKLVLNLLSTGAMARLGYVYGNQMVNVHVKNTKLRDRGLGILEQLARVERSQAERALKNAANSVPVALIMLLAGVDPPSARRHLEEASGNVRRAAEAAKAESNLLVSSKTIKTAQAKSSALATSARISRKMEPPRQRNERRR
jgi:N-acetylmuramic acid 6-phosphate etherase